MSDRAESLRKEMALSGLRPERLRDCLHAADEEAGYGRRLMRWLDALCNADGWTSPAKFDVTPEVARAVLPAAIREVEAAIEHLERAKLALEWAREALDR